MQHRIFVLIALASLAGCASLQSWAMAPPNCEVVLCTDAEAAAQSRLEVTVDLGPRHDGKVTM